MQRIKVKPTKPGLVVLDELSRQIPAKGKVVNKTIHIVRRIKEGSLEVMKESWAPKPKKPPKNASKEKPFKEKSVKAEVEK